MSQLRAKQIKLVSQGDLLIGGASGNGAVLSLGASKGVLRVNAAGTGLEYAALEAGDVGFTSAQGIVATTVAGALDELKTSMSSGSTALQTEVDAIETAVGLDADGKFVAFTGTNYMNAATTITGSLTALDTAVKAEADRAIAAEGALDTRLDDVEANYIKKDGSVAFTGDVDAGSHKVVNVAAPTADGDAANKKYVDDKVAVLGNAFNYVGTVEGGADADSAYDLATLPAGGKDAGDYYKVSVAGYFKVGEGTAFYANVNDGLVFNTTAGVDVIDNTNSSVSGTAGRVSVTGSSDTGFTVDIASNYVGQNTITTVGTITTGTWNGTTVDTAHGGTGLSTIGTAGQVLRTNADADGLEYATLAAEEVTFANAGWTSTDVKSAIIEATTKASADNSALTTEVNAIETSVGLNSDGTMPVFAGTYTTGSSSVIDAINDIDSALNTVAGDLAAEITRATDAETALQTEVDAIETGAGLGANGAYTAKSDANYIQTATSLFDADVKLDAALKTEADRAVAAEGALQTELDATQAGAGLAANGAYVAPTTSNYINSTVSLADADMTLDAAIKAVETNLANLSQDEIKSANGFNSVKTDGTSGTVVVKALDAAGTAGATIATFDHAATSNNEAFKFTNAAGEVRVEAIGTGDVDIRLVPGANGQVIIGDTGAGVIQADDGEDLSLLGGSGAGNLFLNGGGTGKVYYSNSSATPVAGDEVATHDFVASQITSAAENISILSLTDVPDTALANGYLRWNAAANALVFETKIAASVIDGRHEAARSEFDGATNSFALPSAVVVGSIVAHINGLAVKSTKYTVTGSTVVFDTSALGYTLDASDEIVFTYNVTVAA